MIRRGTASDIPSVLAIEKEVFSDAWQNEALCAHLNQDHLSMLVFCDEENTVLGYLLGALILGEGEIFRVATTEKARRRGVASALLDAFLLECDCCFLEVRKHNASARTLYEKKGFSQTGERKNYYKDPTEDACLYRWAK